MNTNTKRQDEAHVAFVNYLIKLYQAGIRHLRIATHNGRFHADEVMAAAILAKLFNEALPRHDFCFTWELLRLDRHDPLLQEAEILIDIGREYDPARGRFDHHQKGGAGKRMQVRVGGELEDVTFSTCGLVWYACGRLITGEYDAVDRFPAFERLDWRLFRGVDASDNGYQMAQSISTRLSDGTTQTLGGSPLHISQQIAEFNRDYNDSNLQQRQFDKALNMAETVFDNTLWQTLQSVKSRTRVLELIDNHLQTATEPKLLVLEETIDWRDHLLHLPKARRIRVVVTPYNANSWCVHLLSRNGEVPLRAPCAWRGLEGAALEHVIGVAGVMFCHNSGHMVRTRTKEAALAVAKMFI